MVVSSDKHDQELVSLCITVIRTHFARRQGRENSMEQEKDTEETTSQYEYVQRVNVHEANLVLDIRTV